MGTKIRETQHVVGIQDTNRTHMIKVETLCNHLCANQNVDFLLLEVVDNLKMGVLAPGGVKIHPGDACFGQHQPQLLLHLLGSETLHPDAGALTFRTFFGDSGHIAAIVAT